MSIEHGSLPGPLGVSLTFALVLAVGVLNYVPDLGQALRSMANALAADGVVIINVPTAERAVAPGTASWNFSTGRATWCADRP